MGPQPEGDVRSSQAGNEGAAQGDRLLDSGLFNPDTLRELVRQPVSGRNDHAAALWLLLMFDAFLAHEAERDGA